MCSILPLPGHLSLSSPLNDAKALESDGVSADKYDTSKWQILRTLMERQLGQATFKSWLSQLSLVRFDPEIRTLILSVPGRFVKDWVDANYLHALLKLAQSVYENVHRIEIIVNTSASLKTPIAEESPVSTLSLPQPPSFITATPANDDDFAALKETIQAQLDQRFNFDNFVVGKPNELAYAAALRVAESREVQFNPLFLYGGVGLGKTHLMHAIAWYIKTHQPERRVLYLSAEKFMYQFIRALRYKDTMTFKELFRNVDVLMIDDVQFISGKDSTQEEFFHTFNALVDKNHQVIVSADKSPSDLEGMEERLKSRLGWGLVADLHPTTYELRLGILQTKAATLSIPIPKEVMEFLAFKITSNVRELERALNRIAAHATLVGRKITIESTQELLRDLLKSNDRRVSVDDIQKRVAEYYSIKLTEMQSAKRTQNIARPRQIAMYLAKMLTTRSLPEIGRRFGGRDHTTVIHAVKKVEELMVSDHELAEDLSILRKSLEC